MLESVHSKKTSLSTESEVLLEWADYRSLKQNEGRDLKWTIPLINEIRCESRSPRLMGHLLKSTWPRKSLLTAHVAHKRDKYTSVFILHFTLWLNVKCGMNMEMCSLCWPNTVIPVRCSFSHHTNGNLGDYFEPNSCHFKRGDTRISRVIFIFCTTAIVQNMEIAWNTAGSALSSFSGHWLCLTETKASD